MARNSDVSQHDRRRWTFCRAGDGHCERLHFANAVRPHDEHERIGGTVDGSWTTAALSGAGGGLLSAVGFGYWIGRNSPTTEDLRAAAKAIFDQMKADTAEIRADVKELEATVKEDRHSARSNMEQRTTIFLEKVDAMRDRYDAATERLHLAELRLTRIEAQQNGH